jgi:hypothetical protein
MDDKDKQLQLPYWCDLERGAPNSILRSALFGIVGTKSIRKIYKNELIASYGGSKFFYSGVSLSQTDLDLWLEIIHIWQKNRSPRMELTRYTIAKLLDKRRSKPLYDRIDKTLDRLFNCSVSIEITRPDGKLYTYKGRLITELESLSHKGKKDWRITVSERLIDLFAHGYTRQLTDIRRSLKSDLARWFYGYISSHKTSEDHPHKISFEKLIPMMGVRSHKAMFKKIITKALNELLEQRVVENFEITDNDVLIVVKRNHLKYLQNH